MLFCAKLVKNIRKGILSMLKKHFFSEMSYIWRRLFKIKERPLWKRSLFLFTCFPLLD